MKFLRLELSKLMNIIKTSGIYSEKIDINLWDELGINNRIRELEKSKRKLDAEIQAINWSTEI